jgi:hypothetical protein
MREAIHPVQLEAFRRMTPAEKIQRVVDLYQAGIRLRMEGLRMRHLDWTDEQLSFEARRSLRHAGT